MKIFFFLVLFAIFCIRTLWLFNYWIVYILHLIAWAVVNCSLEWFLVISLFKDSHIFLELHILHLHCVLERIDHLNQRSHGKLWMCFQDLWLLRLLKLKKKKKAFLRLNTALYSPFLVSATMIFMLLPLIKTLYHANSYLEK